MNPRASDRLRGFQDTIIVVEDVRRISVIVGATLGAELVITLSFNTLSRNLLT